MCKMQLHTLSATQIPPQKKDYKKSLHMDIKVCIRIPLKYSSNGFVSEQKNDIFPVQK